jgi:hypothetical protein
MKKFLELLLGTGLILLERNQTAKSIRRGVAGNIDEISDIAQDKYDIAAERVARASRALRGDDSHAFGNTLRVVAGIGVGVGVGLLVAPPVAGRLERR